MTADDQGALSLGGKNALETKNEISAARTALARQTAALEAQEAELKATIDEQRRALEEEYDARRAELAAQMAPLKKQLERMTEVMWSVDLYLGRDEQLSLIRDGAPAPASTPLTIRQRVLVMAEESLVLLGRKPTGMDAEDIGAFVDWLIADPANLDRVLPEPRGVVVLIPTRVKSKSGNIFEDAARNSANEQTWWLLRNGDRLYLLTTDINVGDRVLPRRKEFTEVFDRRLFGYGRAHGEPLEPGSDEWLKLEEISDTRRRHYMRIMMVLQGLVDRTPVWHPRPPGGVNLMTVEAQESGKVVLIADDEDSIQLGDGRERFAQWQRRLNGQMRPGLRIIGDWRNREFAEIAHDYGYRSHEHPRLFPPSVNGRPETGVPHLIEGRRDGGFVIRFARTDQVWRSNVPVPDKPGYIYRGQQPTDPRRRASCVVMPEDSWVLPFDLASIDELRYYLASREERSQHFLTMVPTLRSAIAAKEAEAAAEAPFRGLLAAQLTGAGADPDHVDELVDELVHWWKLAHSWTRPLNGDQEHEGKAVRQILAEYNSRTAAAADTAAIDLIVAAGRTVPGAVCVARNRRGRWHVYAASPGAQEPQIFLDVTEIAADGTLGQAKTWQTLPQRSASLLRCAWTAEAWSTWKFAANPMHHLSEPEREELVDRIRGAADGIALFVTEAFTPAEPGERELIAYHWTGEQTPEQASPDSKYRRLFPEDDHNHWVTKTRWKITKSRSGAVTATVATGHARQPDFVEHNDDTLPALKGVYIPWGGTIHSGWSGTSRRFKLIWADRAALTRVDGWVQRCSAAEASERDREARENERVDRYVRPILAAIAAAVEAEAKARFNEDFDNAEDLWPAHLRSLKLNTTPIHRREIGALVRASLAGGHTIAGTSLGQLAALTGIDGFGRFASLRIDEPEEAREEASS